MLLYEGGGEFHEAAFVAHREKGQLFHKEGSVLRAGSSGRKPETGRPGVARNTRALAPGAIRAFFALCLVRPKNFPA